MNNHYEDAVDAYYNYCNDNGIIFQQPCKYSSEEDEDHTCVHLNNINGELAKYVIKTKRIIV